MAGDSAGAFARRKRDGADEERATATALMALPREQWRVLHDVPWPGRPRAHIDHVVVGPGGVFVIDSRNWSGAVSVRDGVLRQGPYSRQGVVTSAAEAATAVARLVPTATSRVSPVLCLVRSDALAANAEGVLVCSTANVADLLTARSRVLADVQVKRLAVELGGGQRLEMPTSRAHRRSSLRVRYLVGAVAAMAVAITLVRSPEIVTGAVEDVASFVADLVNDDGGQSSDTPPPDELRDVRPNGTGIRN
jgi:hypothetical protein